MLARATRDRTGEIALAVFTGKTDLPFLRLLRPGFRHCFALLPDGAGWIVYEPLSDRTEISRLGPIDRETLVRRFTNEGCTAVSWRIGPPRLRVAFPEPFTCVAAVKRALRVHAPAALTPFALYRNLTVGGDDRNKIRLFENIH